MEVFRRTGDLRGSVLTSCLKEMQILKEQGAYIKIGSKTVLGGKEILLSRSLVSRWNRLEAKQC